MVIGAFDEAEMQEEIKRRAPALMEKLVSLHGIHGWVIGGNPQNMPALICRCVDDGLPIYLSESEDNLKELT